MLVGLAASDFLLAEVEYAMELIPELSESRALKEACTRAEVAMRRMWRKLGLYGRAATWARKGLALSVTGTLPRPGLDLEDPAEQTEEVFKGGPMGVTRLLQKELQSTVEETRPSCREGVVACPVSLPFWSLTIRCRTREDYPTSSLSFPATG